jgi:hypothetical protein
MNHTIQKPEKNILSLRFLNQRRNFMEALTQDGEYIFIVDLEEYGLFRGHCVCVTLDWSHVTDDSFKLLQQQELWYSYS